MSRRPSLRLGYHRGTTAHVASVYPFSVQSSLGHRGTYIGLDLLAGAGEFCWDPFEAYTAGLVTNPNAWILGEPGNGKSALIKTMLWRQSAIYGHGSNGRWTAIIDPKGEYTQLAEHLGLTTIRLAPGGTTRLNPLSPSTTSSSAPTEGDILRRASMCNALIATVLQRPLSQLEDTLLFRTVEHLARQSQPTLTDLAHALAAPPAEMPWFQQAPGSTGDLTAVTYALDKLVTRSLRGMFDGPSTVTLHSDGAGLVIDLSAIPLASDALPLIMVAAAGWLQQLITAPGPRRVQVLDEAWALLGNRHTAAYLQSCFKLGRTYGAANLCVTHRASDLAAQADDGTATAKIAAGLLADAATKIILRQAPDQLAAATTHFGLTEPEAQVISHLGRGRSLWKLGNRTALVHHILSPAEQALCDTDARMHQTGIVQ